MLFTLLLSFILAGIMGPQVADFREFVEIREQFDDLAINDQAQGEQAGPEIVDRDNLGPQITARGAVAVDVASRQVLWSKDVDERYPIASISKLMAAMVYLDTKPDLDEVVTMLVADETYGATAHIGRGEQVYAEDLLYASLITSDNNSVEALVRVSGLEREEFIAKMKQKARELGMINTNFVEPTGLKFANIASPRDVARLLEVALTYDEILDAVGRKTYDFVAVTGKSHRIYSTNSLLTSYLDVVGGKTGFNKESRYNLTSAIDGPQGQRVIVAVLGSVNYDARFHEVKAVADWVFENYSWNKTTTE